MDPYKIEQLTPQVSAVIFTGPNAISNVGLIQTKEGVVVIDTTRGKQMLQTVLNKASVDPKDANLVIITHLHSDHVNGIGLFECPILCHERAKKRIAGKRSATLKTISFDTEYQTNIGGLELLAFHTPGHTPESIIVWLPESKILFSGDLIFSGRPPFMAAYANISQLLDSLNRLLDFRAEVIVPGHGPLCDDKEVHAQIYYLETTWEVVKKNVAAGNPISAILKDEALPKAEGRNFERNVEWMYKRIKKKK